jgi:threonine aldolase
MNFASDNTAGAPPEIIDAIVRANSGTDSSYGADQASRRLTRKFSDFFGTDVTVFPVATGTAANALALASITPRHGVVFCHQGAHIHVDECGAPEFYTSAKLVPVPSPDGKVTLSGLRDAARHFHRGDVHHAQPASISLSQSTELGTVYATSDVSAISAFARAEQLAVHMDGARFSNALVSLGCTPADVTWKAGVDVLSFGATKNGALGAEAVIFFDSAHVGDFSYMRKRAGHLFSKMRFVSAQLEAMLDGDLWRRLATHANSMATRLEAGLGAIPGVTLAQPVQANEVFFTVPNHTARRALLDRGAKFLLWSPPADEIPLIRLVCSFATPAEDVDRFVGCVREVL